eukprot:1159183-Pelagomonas_calceolata.AAC.24
MDSRADLANPTVAVCCGQGARRVVETTLSAVATFPEPSRRQHLGPLLVSHVLAELAHAKAEAEVAAAWRRAFQMLCIPFPTRASHFGFDFKQQHSISFAMHAGSGAGTISGTAGAPVAMYEMQFYPQ